MSYSTLGLSAMSNFLLRVDMDMLADLLISSARSPCLITGCLQMVSAERSHVWMRSIINGKMASFDKVAAVENLGERYVRRLTVLAYLSP